MTVTEDFLFSSAHAALVFSFNYSSQYYERPLMTRLASPPTGGGKGLAGMDGAAQAGFIRAEVQSLGTIAEAILIARMAQRFESCSCRASCCSGRKPNREWTAAIAVLADHVRATALAGCTSNGLLRREYVVRHFSPKDQRIGLEALAEKHGIHRDTASAHYGRVAKLLGGSRKGRDQVPGLEDTAKNAIDARLREIGLVGNGAEAAAA